MKEDNIKELIHKINEVGYIYTPLNLCDQMINSLPNLDGDILVIRNIEFVYVLYTKNIDMSRVYYSTDCEIKKKIAIHLGIKENNIIDLEYNNVSINIDMKFDVVIQNPPYNPNSIWKKFVEKGISLLKDDGHMVAIHPDNWMYSSTHKNIYDKLKYNISELHITGFNTFKDANISTDWYVYNKNGSDIIIIHHLDGTTEILKNKDITRFLKISQSSLAFSILQKITKNNYNNGIIQAINSWCPLYKGHTVDGKYKQCGGEGNGTGWCENKFTLTNDPSEHQFENKVVMAYVRKPRAKYFSGDENVGVICANYWLTNNNSLPILLNSNMFWKIHKALVGFDEKQKRCYTWFLKSLNFEDLNVQTEEELYKHYNLTTEEINWINE